MTSDSNGSPLQWSEPCDAGLVASAVLADIQRSTRKWRIGRQACSYLLLLLFLLLTISFSMGISIVQSSTFVPMTVEASSGPSGVSTYSPAGNGTASYSSFRYIEVQPFINTTTDGSGLQTQSSTAFYLLVNTGFSCQYSVYTQIDHIRLEWLPNPDGLWSYSWAADSGQQMTLAIPSCGLLTLHSVALIFLCLSAAWEGLLSPCMRVRLALSEEFLPSAQHARLLSLWYTLSLIFNVLAIACCVIVIATLWAWINATRFPQQSTQSIDIANTVLAAVIVAIYSVDLPLNYFALLGMLKRAKEIDEDINASPIRFQLLYNCGRKSARQRAHDAGAQ